MKYFYVVIAVIMLIAALPVSVAARELEDYYYEDDYYTPYDDSWEYYYPRGVVLDDSGVIHIDGGSVSMTVGKTKDLAEGRNYHSLSDDLEISIVGGKKWASNNPDVASVDSNGVVTAQKIGSTRITVSHADNRGYRVTQTIRLTVSSGNGSLTSKPDNYFEIVEGKRIFLGDLLPSGFDAGNTVWATSKEKIATVDSDGLVTAHSIGSCTVTALFAGEDGTEQTVSFSIRVSSALHNNRSRDIHVTIPAGTEPDIVKLFYPNYASYGTILRDIQCTTSDSKTVDLQEHEIKALQKGSCTVTITYYDKSEIEERQRITVKVTTL